MAFSLVNSVNAHGLNTTTSSAIDTTGATLLVIALSRQPTSTPSFSDSKGNTWTAAPNTASEVLGSTRFWYCINPTVGTGHTFTATGTTIAIDFTVTAWSGMDTGETTYSAHANVTASNASTLQPGSITPPNDNSLVIAVMGGEGTTGATVDSGFTELTDNAYSAGNYYALDVAYKIQTTAAAVNPTFSSDKINSASIISFKAAAVDTTPDITTTSLPATTIGASYSQTLGETSGDSPFTWSIISGALPTGLSLNSSTGAITGTVGGSAGTYNFTVQIQDTDGDTDSQALSIVVNAAPVISTTSLPDATQGSAYSQTVSKTGGTGSGTFSVVTGSLPAGLSLNSSTGAITGTPSGTGTSSFTVRYTDTVSISDDQDLSITVNVVDSSPTITTSSLPDGTVGTAYSQTISKTGGNAPFTWAVSSGVLPDGLSLNTSTGVIFGTPTTEETQSFTITVTDTDGDSDPQDLSINIVAGTPPVTSINGYELLQLCGSFGAGEDIWHAVLEAPYGADGHGQSALFGSKTGLKSWRLKFDVLAQTLRLENPYLNGEEVNPADYLWDFYCRHRATGQYFVIKSLRNNQYYLAAFTDERLSYEKFAIRLFTTGIAIEQRRVSGDTVFDPARVKTAIRSIRADELDLADGASVAEITDAVSGLNLTAAATQPVFETLVQNNHGIIRFSGTANPLTSAATFSFKHLFIVAKYNGATFANDAGLITDAAGWGGLIGVSGDTVFKALSTLNSDVNWRAFVNGAEVDPDDIPAPMNEFKLIEIRADESVEMVGLSIGKDRAGGAKWNGDFAEMFASEKALFESDVWEIEENLMEKWSIN